MREPSNLDRAMEDASAWLEIPGVEGVAVSEQDGQQTILVMASVSPGSLARLLPESIRGIRVSIQASGPNQAEQT